MRPVKAGDVVILSANTLCGSEPRSSVTVTTPYLDRDYVIDQVFWQYAARLMDSLDARDFAEEMFSEPAQVLRLGEDRAGMLMPWLDELVALSRYGPGAGAIPPDAGAAVRHLGCGVSLCEDRRCPPGPDPAESQLASSLGHLLCGVSHRCGPRPALRPNICANSPPDGGRCPSWPPQCTCHRPSSDGSSSRPTARPR